MHKDNTSPSLASQLGPKKYLFHFGLLHVEPFLSRIHLLWQPAMVPGFCEHVYWKWLSTVHTQKLLDLLALNYEPANQMSDLKFILIQTGCINIFTLKRNINLNVNIKNMNKT